MKNLLSNPYFARLLGALGATATTYATNGQNLKSAALTGVTFLGYSVVHSTATAAGDGEQR